MDGRLNRPLKSKKQPSGGQRLKNHLLNVGKNNVHDDSNAKLSGKPAAYEMARQLDEINIMKKLEKQAMAQAAKKARQQEALSAAELKSVKKEQMKIDDQQRKRQKQQEAANGQKMAAEKHNKEIQHLQQLRKERQLKLRGLALAKKPKEDMCLADLKCLPELSKIPGLVLEGNTLFNCLKVLQFFHTYGKVLGLNYLNDLDLSVLLEGLRNTRGSMEKVQDLLVSMISSAIQDPGLPAGHRSITLLGENLTNVAINRDNVSEFLQIYMEAHCDKTESAVLSLSLRTKAFQAHGPSQKAAMLSVLIDVLCCSKAVISEINKKMDHMTNLQMDELTVEGMLRQLRSLLTNRTEKGDSSVGGHDKLTFDEDSKVQAEDHDEEEEDSEGPKAEIREEEDDSVNFTSVEELEKQIEKLIMYQSQIKQRLLHSSHSQRSMMIGQDRYKRRYWLLPELGGIFVEGMESSEGYEEMKEIQETAQVIRIKEVEASEMEWVSSPYGPSPATTLQGPADETDTSGPYPLCSPKLKRSPFIRQLIIVQDDQLKTQTNNTVNRLETPEALCDKPPCALVPAVEAAKTQDYPSPQPVPKEMLHGWWRVSDMQELHSLVEALHSRGIREKVLKKQFQEHMEYLTQLYANSKDAFDVAKLEKHQVREKTVASWCVEEQAMEVDIHQLQQVEALERRVVSAGLQIKGWMHPEPQSEREDLVYQEDNAVRRPNNPLDIAVMRLAELERGIDRSEEKVTPGMSLWHQALGEVRSSAQLSLCIQQLQKSIDWDRPVKKVENTELLRSRKQKRRALGGGKRDRDQLDSRGSSAKKAKLAKDDRYWLEMCRVLLAELEAHQDARPFLTPVNLKAKPWYKRIIKKPMDFSTIGKKLSNNQYLNFETFVMEVNLVFENCEKCNEDDSTIGRAGISMKEFFAKRWAELLRHN